MMEVVVELTERGLFNSLSHADHNFCRGLPYTVNNIHNPSYSYPIRTNTCQCNDRETTILKKSMRCPQTYSYKYTKIQTTAIARP